MPDLLTATSPQAYLQFVQELTAFLDALEGNVQGSAGTPVRLPAGIEGRFGVVARTFGLSVFEQFVLALAVAQEVHPLRTRRLLAGLMGLEDGLSATLTPYACLQLLDIPDPLAFAPGGPLLHHGLLEVGAGLSPDASLRTLTVQPGVLLFIQGHAGLDAQLSGFTQVLNESSPLSVTQHQRLAEGQAFMNRSAQAGVPGVPLLHGHDLHDLRVLALELLRPHGPPVEVDLNALLWQRPDDLPRLLTALARESTLRQFPVVLNACGEPPERPAAALTLPALLERLLDSLPTPAAVLADAPLTLNTARVPLPLAVEPPTPQEQREAWAAHLHLQDSASPLLQQLGDQFHLNLNQITHLSRAALSALPGQEAQDAAETDSARITQAWEGARQHNRRLMGSLAERVPTRATWSDLILPEGDLAVLRQITTHIRHRTHVYENLGLARPGRGRAVTALFSGPSGTGKTLSAEVLANDLDLDLYRIDLSSTVSKYIGETEKNLRRIFDAADRGGCILLFDEADSVFGKRGEVRDSNDRYANNQVNYLLQRLESFNGLAVLTTNMESSLDTAFLRRISFVLNFRPPQATEREQIWRHALKNLDTGQVNFARLAQAELSGGNIRSVALNATFMAVARGTPLTQELLEDALNLEYRKLGRLVWQPPVRPTRVNSV